MLRALRTKVLRFGACSCEVVRVSGDKKIERVTVALDETLKARVLEHQSYLKKSTGIEAPESEVVRGLLRRGLDVVEGERKKRREVR